MSGQRHEVKRGRYSSSGTSLLTRTSGVVTYQSPPRRPFEPAVASGIADGLLFPGQAVLTRLDGLNRPLVVVAESASLPRPPTPARRCLVRLVTCTTWSVRRAHMWCSAAVLMSSGEK